MKLGGATDINQPLLESIQMIKKDILSINQPSKQDMTLDNDVDIVDSEGSSFFMNQIVLLTDGAPTRGVRDTKQILRNVEEANDLSDIDAYSTKINIFAFGVGRDTNDSSWINDLDHNFLKV